MGTATKVRRWPSVRKIGLFLAVSLGTATGLEAFSLAAARLYSVVVGTSVLPARVALSRARSDLSSEACAARSDLPGAAAPVSAAQLRMVRAAIWEVGTTFGQLNCARDFRLLGEADLATRSTSWTSLVDGLGIPAPSFSPTSGQNRLELFRQHLQGDPDCLAERLKRRYSEREARLFQLAAFTGYTAIAHVVDRNLPEPFAAPMSLAGELAGVPPHLMTALRADVRGKSKEEAIQILMGAQSAVRAHLESESPATTPP